MSINISRKIAFAAAVVAASFLAVSVVDAAVFRDAIVKCLPENADVCVGEISKTSPSPGMICSDPEDPESCEKVYMGGYSWVYSFVEGLQEQTDDFGAIEAAKTGFSIKVSVDDDSTCEVSIGDETCSSCSLEGCNSTSPVSIKYDCTNVENGGESLDKCVSMDTEPFFYPLRLASEEEVDTVGNDADISKVVETGDEGLVSSAADDVMASGDSSSATKTLSRVILGTETVLSLLLFGVLPLN